VTPLLLDQGPPRSTPRHLQQLGIQATHVADIGLSRAGDSQIIDQARSDRTAIVTLDADFHALIAVSGAARPTVIRIRREGLNGAEIAALIADVLLRLPEAIAQGALITVTESTIRIRHLPIKRPSSTGRREGQS
jgi:predicted nuclease of predicted toxin-antitoxin system